MRATPKPLERLFLTVPEQALEPYEAALASTCDTVAFFRDDVTGIWQIEGVREAGTLEGPLTASLALAESLTGIAAELHREPLNAQGWIGRSYAAFPEQLIGRRFAIRGSHITTPPASGRVPILIDAGMAFGSGEHGSTRGCLIALECLAPRGPRRILDLGTGSGVLAIAAARLLRRKILAADIDPWSVRLTCRNVRRNAVGHLVRTRQANGWRGSALKKEAPYDLIFANILARPLALMAAATASHLAPGGVVILSGLLSNQTRTVLAAHRRHGLSLAFRVDQLPWTTLVMRKPPQRRD